MKRLTMYVDGHVYYTKDGQPILPIEILDTPYVREVLRRLAEYEDTGLMPNEIEAVKHDMTMPKGYREIDKMLCADSIKNKGINLDDVDGVFLGKGEIVITGAPIEDDESHNCDAMGCSSVSHVLYRASI
jgi:hypothetical protein